jgi:hypothetical protein
LRKAYVIIALVLSNLFVGAGAFVGARLSVAHDPNADPYKYCFKINSQEIPQPFRYGIPNGTYAVCRIGP